MNGLSGRYTMACRTPRTGRPSAPRPLHGAQAESAEPGTGGPQRLRRRRRIHIPSLLSPNSRRILAGAGLPDSSKPTQSHRLHVGVEASAHPGRLHFSCGRRGAYATSGGVETTPLHDASCVANTSCVKRKARDRKQCAACASLYHICRAAHAETGRADSTATSGLRPLCLPTW